METPMTKKGRWKPKPQKIKNNKMDLKSLSRCNEVKKSFLDAVTREFTKPEQLNSGNQPEQINSNIVKCLNTAAASDPTTTTTTTSATANPRRGEESEIV